MEIQENTLCFIPIKDYHTMLEKFENLPLFKSENLQNAAEINFLHFDVAVCSQVKFVVIGFAHIGRCSKD
jgi:hypothetical protein